MHGMKRNAADLAKEFESYALGDVQGLVLNHNGHLAELKSKIHMCLREGLVSTTGDAKATMQFDQYEKLIIVDKGVALFNWLDDIPFVNASEIGSIQMNTAIGPSFQVKSGKNTRINIMSQCHCGTQKQNRKAHAAMTSDSEEEAVEAAPSKRPCQAKGSLQKENMAPSESGNGKKSCTVQEEAQAVSTKKEGKGKDKAACQENTNNA
ncbi:hypothetical protein K439DRAFT_1615793 [Ramaria rubella]|nr:hypothetical protein K439DRAFT_1615793 [Ramaria rubella]